MSQSPWSRPIHLLSIPCHSFVIRFPDFRITPLQAFMITSGRTMIFLCGSFEIVFLVTLVSGLQELVQRSTVVGEWRAHARTHARSLFLSQRNAHNAPAPSRQPPAFDEFLRAKIFKKPLDLKGEVRKQQLRIWTQVSRHAII